MDAQLAPIVSRKRAQNFNKQQAESSRKRQRVDSAEVDVTATSDPTPQRLNPKKKDAASLQGARARQKALRKAWKNDTLASTEAGPATAHQSSKAADAGIEQVGVNNVSVLQTQSTKKARGPVSCGACGEVGHIRTNKTRCPARNGTWLGGVKPVEAVVIDDDVEVELEHGGIGGGKEEHGSGAVQQDMSEEESEAEFAPKMLEENDGELDSLFVGAEVNEELLEPENSLKNLQEGDSEEADLESEDIDNPKAQVEIQRPLKDSHRDETESALLSSTIDLTEEQLMPAEHAPKEPDVAEEVIDWTAKLFVNNAEVGTYNSIHGLELLKPMPKVRGFRTSMTGYVEATLSVRKRFRRHLAIGGSMPTNTAQARFAKFEGNDKTWDDRDNYCIYIGKHKPCKEIRINVFQGYCIVARDEEQRQYDLEAEEKRKVIDITSDGSLDFDSSGETFEDWRTNSNDRMDRIKHMRTFPRFPESVNKCRTEVGTLDIPEGCKRYKQVENKKVGSMLNACPHDIKQFILGSKTCREQSYDDLIEFEFLRFNTQDWYLIEDDEVRKDITKAVSAYLGILNRLRYQLEEEDIYNGRKRWIEVQQKRQSRGD